VSNTTVTVITGLGSSDLEVSYGSRGPAGAAGPAGLDALWNFRGAFNDTPFIRVTGTFNGNQVTIPDLYYAGEFNGRPQYIGGTETLRWSTVYWLFDGLNLYSSGSAYDAQSPELVTQWLEVGTDEPLITTLTLAKLWTSYEIGDVVTYGGETWYCYTANTFDPEAPEYPPSNPDYWQLIAAKGADGVIGFGYDSLTSSTSRQIGLNNKQFTVNRDTSETAYIVGTRVRVIPSAAPSQFMEGNIIAFVDNSLTVFVDHVVGAGTYTDWDFSVAGLKGDVVGAVTLSGDQLNINGNKTFKNQIQLDGQSLTDNNSALTMGLADARYGTTYVGIKEDNVSSTNTTPIKLTSVTLPVGTYQIDSCIAAYATVTGHGGYMFGLRASANIKTSLLEFYGNDGATITNNVSASDLTLLSQRDITSTTLLTNKRQLVGLLEVLTNNTEVSIEFCQSATSATANTTRKRAYIIARKIA
jgi:hypothetical protein